MKLRVTKRGCYGRIDGVIKELPIGYEFTAEEIPSAFADRVITLEQDENKVDTDKKKKDK